MNDRTRILFTGGLSPTDAHAATARACAAFMEAGPDRTAVWRGPGVTVSATLLRGALTVRLHSTLGDENEAGVSAR